MILLIDSQSMCDFLELLELKEGVDQFIKNNFSPAGKTCDWLPQYFEVNQKQKAMMKPRNRQPKQPLQVGFLKQTLET